MIWVPDYWPTPAKNEIWRFTYDGPIELITDFFLHPETGELTCDDYQNGVWKDRWYFKTDPILGLTEVADDLEVTNRWERLLIGDKKKIVYKDGKGIIWGGWVQIGDCINGPVEIDHRRSNVLPPWTTKSSFAYQAVIFEREADDTLQFVYTQPWGSKVYGARYYNRKHVGPMKIEWRKPDGTFTDPVHAKFKILKW